MLSLSLDLEQFTSRRREAQTRLEALLVPSVRDAIKEGDWSATVRYVLSLFAGEYKDETGDYYTGKATWSKDLARTLDKGGYDRLHSVNETALWLATLILTRASIEAAVADPEEVFLEWVNMHDSAVRESHREAGGQVRPAGDKFEVGGHEMVGPGDISAPVEEWIECRCTLRPTLASTMAERVDAEMSRVWPLALEGAPAAVRASMKLLDLKARRMGLTTGGSMDPETDVTDAAGPEWYGVLAPEGVWSGDKRKFAEDSLTWRPLPLPLTWQKIGADAHNGHVTVASIKGTYTDPDTHLAWGWGNMLRSVPEAAEFTGLLAEFGRYGVSVDADSTTFELDDEEEGIVFSAARGCSACAVAIPAFAEAFVSLGRLPDEVRKKMPEDPYADPEVDPQAEVDPGADQPATEPSDAPVHVDHIPAHVIDAMPPEVADHIKKVKQGATADASLALSDDMRVQMRRGAGWVTNPEATRRIHSYWTTPGQPGYAKIGWGTPDDYSRCIDEIGQEIAEKSPEKLRYIHAQCAQWQHDAIGIWPGKGEKASLTDEELASIEVAPALHLVASVTPPEVADYPAAWFSMPEPDLDDPRVVTDEDGPGVPFTVTKHGQVYGHVARWGACHINNPQGLGVCTTPPHSMSGYREFHVHAAHLDDGTVIPAGAVTVGGGHADLHMNLRAAREHYDDVSTAAAHVVATEGSMGIWVCGSITPWATAEQLAMLRSIPVSGDWREDRIGNAEMIAAHAVVTPGFRQPRVRVAAAGERVTAMVASVGIAPTGSAETPDLGELVATEVAAALERKAEMDRIVMQLEGVL